jgi:hypothetical protein
MTPASLFSLLIDFDPTVLPDRKIRGGLQQSIRKWWSACRRMAEILIFALHLDIFGRPSLQKARMSRKLASNEWTFDPQPRGAV